MKKSQIWSFDLIIGITIFLIVMLIYFIFAGNLSSGKSYVDEMEEESIVISSKIISEGFPSNWTSEHYNSIGISSGSYRLDSKKLANLSIIEYEKLRFNLNSKYDFVIFFENKTDSPIEINGVTYVGKQGINKDNVYEKEEPTALIQHKRFLIYDSNIITMVIYLWQ